MLVEIVCEEDVVSTVFQDLSRNQKLVFFSDFYRVSDPDPDPDPQDPHVFALPGSGSA